MNTKQQKTLCKKRAEAVTPVTGVMQSRFTFT